MGPTDTDHTCDECGVDALDYGRTAGGRKLCYQCCAGRDRADMLETGRAILYLDTGHTFDRIGTHGQARVTNWPGTLVFTGRYSVGRHNIARKRFDVDFVGPDDHIWHGVTYGESTQLCRCKRTKRKVERHAHS